MAEQEGLNFLKERLGYTDAQWETWKSNPRNLKMVENLKDRPKYKVIAEVISSYGCGAGHRVGDKMVYSGGSLLCRENPEEICVFLLSNMNPFVQSVFRDLARGVEPTQMDSAKIHCPDAGLEYGGWGEVVVEMQVEKAQE